MSAKCCALNCHNYSNRVIDTRTGKTIRMHRFPNPEIDSERCLTWIQNMGLYDLSINAMNYKEKKLCSLHFDYCAYCCPTDIGQSSLLPTGVPTLLHSVALSQQVGRKRKAPKKEPSLKLKKGQASSYLPPFKKTAKNDVINERGQLPKALVKIECQPKGNSNFKRELDIIESETNQKSFADGQQDVSTDEEYLPVSFAEKLYPLPPLTDQLDCQTQSHEITGSNPGNAGPNTDSTQFSVLDPDYKWVALVLKDKTCQKLLSYTGGYLESPDPPHITETQIPSNSIAHSATLKEFGESSKIPDVLHRQKCDMMTSSTNIQTATTTTATTTIRERVPVKCGDCGKSFRHDGSLRRHMITHVRGKRKPSFNCGMCGRSYTNNDSLGKHMSIHTAEKTFQCDECEQRFRLMSEYHRHKKDHAQSKEPPFKCYECGEIFELRAQYCYHIKTHGKGSSSKSQKQTFQCNECGKSFRLNAILKNHMRTHTGEKPFQCETCDKCFSRRAACESHMRTHTGERPFQCDECGKNFRQISILKVHMRTHSGEKLFQCDHCSMIFCDEGNLNVHMRRHAGEKPFKCGKRVCNSRSHRCNLHARTTTAHIMAGNTCKNKSFDKCGGSGMSFHRKGRVRTHTGEKSFEFDGCGMNMSLSKNRDVLIETGEKAIEL